MIVGPSGEKKVLVSSRRPRPMEVRGARQYGVWDRMLRTLGGFTPDGTAAVSRWHLRDALLAYEDHLRQLARESYHHAVLVFSALAPYARKGSLKPPKIPRILAE